MNYCPAVSPAQANFAVPHRKVAAGLRAAIVLPQMETITKESLIVQRTQELCQAIIDQSDFPALKQNLDAFMSDEALKFQFQQVNQAGEMLHHKQSQGLELNPEEIALFETLREQLMANPIATRFLEAQERVKEVHQIVGSFLEKTFELGRRPEYADVHSGSCGNCDCH